MKQGNKSIGIAPMSIRGETASIIGSTDVCDYLDFPAAPGMEKDFFTILLDDLRQQGISRLELKLLRPDSTTLTNLAPLARQRKYEVLCQQEAVSVELDLPSTWEEYLAILDKKQRHELKRKLRRLWEAGNVEYRCTLVNQDVSDFMHTFLKLFSLSHEEKARFMTKQM